MLLHVASLLTAVAMATAAVPDPGLRCHCFLRNVLYRQVDISCGSQRGSGTISCEKGVSGWIPPGYRFVPGIPALYKLYRTNKFYREAEEFCKQDGGHLAVPKKKEEALAIADVMKESPRVGEAYVGINDIQTEGKFVTVTGVEATYLQWSPGQPDNNGPRGQDCVTINAKGELNDNRCDTWGLAFLCQRDLDPAPPPDYKYLPRLGFYKLYTTRITYPAARDRCLQDGAHLAVLDTQEEADELVKFFDTADVEEFYVGLNDEAVEGTFVTETGKPVEALFFRNWGPNEPNNAFGNEDCVTFHVAGTLNDVDCKRTEAFACEMEPPSS